jgi:hypothetical protein
LLIWDISVDVLGYVGSKSFGLYKVVITVPTIRYLSRKGVIMMFSFSCSWCFADRRDRNIPTVKAFKKSLS